MHPHFDNPFGPRLLFKVQLSESQHIELLARVILAKNVAALLGVDCHMNQYLKYEASNREKTLNQSCVEFLEETV
jgi:hypothetical protein